MSDTRPDHQGSSLPTRMILGLFRFLASSALATILIALIAAVLAWATWIESRYGTPAVQQAVYQSDWFAVLMAVLAVNVLAAALIRFPWQRKQIGFLIVHAGILVLLLGCWVSREGTVNGHLSLFEGESLSEAANDDQQLVLVVADREAKDLAAATEIYNIPFQPGPFNWSDYDQLSRFPWHWMRRDRGVLFDQDGIKLEVLDYDSDSQRVPVPELKVRLGQDETTLVVKEFRSRHMPGRSLLIGSQDQLAAKIVFRMATSEAETKAFREIRPEKPLGPLGQVVFYVKDKSYHFSVKDLQGKGPVALGKSGYRIAMADLDPKSLRLLIEVYAPGQSEGSGSLMLSAVRPDINQQDSRNQVFGSYWYAADEKTANKPTSDETKDAEKDDKAKPKQSVVVPEAVASEAGKARVDLLQGTDLHLYYRTSRKGLVEKVGELPTNGTRVTLFDKEKKPLKLSVVSFLPAKKPGYEVVPVALEKNDRQPEARTKMRLTVDDNTRTFWLDDPLLGDRQHAFDGVQSKKRIAMVRIERPAIDLGFQFRLKKFECQFDPGTSRASHYSSLVDFLTSDKEPQVLAEDVLIEPNRPAKCVDPISGRTYRFFQLRSFDGPFVPERVGRKRLDNNVRSRTGIYRTSLIVAYDPGRELKYAGCFMIIIGIIVMYYMKAYFFQRRKRPQAVEGN